MNGRRHPDDDSILEGHGHVVARIAKKRQGGFQIDVKIEDAACDVGQDTSVALSKNFDFDSWAYWRRSIL